MSRFARFAVWAFASSILLAPSARAEPASGSGVTVDWGALDALGPAKTQTPSVVLKPPPGAAPKPAVAPKHAVAPPKPPAKQASLPKPATKPIRAKPKEVAAPAAPAEAALVPESAAPPPPNVKPTAPPPAKVASTAHAPLPPAPTISPTAPVVSRRVSFDPGKSALSPEVQAALDDVATRMAADATLRLELDAYADAASADSNDARRLSRARAEAMRSYLVDKGISVVRVDLRALGNRSDDNLPSDRVDLVFLEH